MNALKKEAIEFIGMVYVTKAGEQYDFTLLYDPLRFNHYLKKRFNHYFSI